MDLQEILKPYDSLIPRLEGDLCVSPPLKRFPGKPFDERAGYSLSLDLRNFTETPLHRAAAKNDRKRTIRLWELGWPLSQSDVNGNSPLDIMKASNNTGLRNLEEDVKGMLEAARRGNIEDIKISFRKGLTPFMPNALGRFAIHEAIESRSISMVNFLLEFDSQRHLQLWDKSSRQYPLHTAAKIGFGPALERILDGGVDVNMRRQPGHTPLFLAAENCQTDAVRILLRRGAQVLVAEVEYNPSSGHDGTPLYAVLADGKGIEDVYQTVKLLVESQDGHKCVNLAGMFQQTPAVLAARRGYKTSLILLLEHGASVNAGEALGRTLLHWLAEHGWHDILQQHVDEFSLDQFEARYNGRTPLEIAQEKGHSEFAELLRSRLPSGRVSKWTRNIRRAFHFSS